MERKKEIEIKKLVKEENMREKSKNNENNKTKEKTEKNKYGR